MSKPLDDRQKDRKRSQEEIKNEYISLLANYEAKNREERLDELWQQLDAMTRMNLLM